MGGVSSARPDNLEAFVKGAGDATDRLSAAHARAAGEVEGFYAAAQGSPFNQRGADEAFRQLAGLVANNRTDERWIEGIRRAFIDADTDTLPDVTIAHSLAAQGINPNPPGQLTADEPVYKGATMYSGWTDDPVSTAAGNFFEAEADLAMPEALAPLAWLRCYNSRFATAGAHGRGWTCWADTRLEVAAEVVTYHGPDGQEAPFARSADGTLVAHPTATAELAPDGDGWELRWRWTSRFPGERWAFDGSGRLLRITDRSGSVTAVRRDDAGRVTALEHEGGRRLEVRWAAGRIAALESSDGRRVEYGYDGEALISVRRPGGGRRYTHGADGLVAEVFDDDDVRLVANVYDAEGRVVAQTSPHGRVAQLRYRPATLVVSDDRGEAPTLWRHDPVGRLVELQLADGSRATRRFDVAGNPVEVTGFDGRVTRRTFDGRSRCVAEEHAGGIRRWEYDDLDRVVVAVDDAGVETRFGYDGPGPLPVEVTGPLGFRTRFAVAAGRVVSAVDADGVAIHFGYDTEGQLVSLRDGEGGVTHFTYHRSGQPESVERPTGEIVRWEYDDDDRAVTAVGADGEVYSRTYSPAGRLVEEGGPDGWQRRVLWGPHGDPVETVDPTGARTALAWDTDGAVSAVTQDDGGVWSYRRDAVGHIESIRQPGGEDWKLRWTPAGLASVVDPAGHARTYDVDVTGAGTTLTVATAAGRSFRMRYGAGGRLESGDTPEGPSRLDVAYDEAGRPARWSVDDEVVAEATYTPAGRLQTFAQAGRSTARLRYDRAGRVVSVTDGGGSTEISYDWCGRPVRMAGPDGSAVSIGWDRGGHLTSFDSAGRPHTIGHDRLGRPVSLTGPDGTTTAWSYDAAGRLTRTVGPEGETVTLTRDGLGRIVALVGPEGGRWTFGHDPSSQPSHVTDPLGRTTRYRHDPLGRLQRMERPDGSVLHYDWDPDGSLLSVRAVLPGGDEHVVMAVEAERENRSAGIRDSAGHRLELGWDGQGRVVRSDDGSGETTVDWTEPSEPLIGRADGTAIRTGVSDGGLPTTIEHPVLGRVDLERDRAGRLLAVRAAGLTRTWERDASGDAVAYREEVGGRVRWARLERDRAGRIVAVTEDGIDRSYRYDDSGRLVAATGPEGSTEWAHDRSGRLTAERGHDGERRFSYDEADQLVAVYGPDGRTVCDYDSLGRRTAERGPGGETRYHWDAADRLVAVERRDADGEARLVELAYDPLGRLVSAGGRPLAWGPAEGPLGFMPSRIGDRELVAVFGAPLAEIDGAAVTWVSTDWRGSVGTRDPWGSSGRAAAPHPEIGFLGEIEVEGLVWLRNRWYDPATHTFLSRDPFPPALEAVHGANPYLYAANDPLQYVDPLGLSPIKASDASAQMEAWKHGHLGQVLTTLAAAAAITAMVILAPEASALILPMVLGGAAGAGGTVVGDLIHHTPIDWTQVVMDGAVGAALGGAGGILGGAGRFMKPIAGLAGKVVGVGYGAGSGAAFTYIDRATAGQDFNLRDELISAGTGGLAGGIASRFHVQDDYEWQDAMKTMPKPMSPKQIAAFEKGGPVTNFYKARVAAATKEAERLSYKGAVTNTRTDAGWGAAGGVAAGAATPGDPTREFSSVYGGVPEPSIPGLP